MRQSRHPAARGPQIARMRPAVRTRSVVGGGAVGEGRELGTPVRRQRDPDQARKSRTLRGLCAHWKLLSSTGPRHLHRRSCATSTVPPIPHPRGVGAEASQNRGVVGLSCGTYDPVVNNDRRRRTRADVARLAEDGLDWVTFSTQATEVLRGVVGFSSAAAGTRSTLERCCSPAASTRTRLLRVLAGGARIRARRREEVVVPRSERTGGACVEHRDPRRPVSQRPPPLGRDRGLGSRRDPGRGCCCTALASPPVPTAPPPSSSRPPPTRSPPWSRSLTVSPIARASYAPRWEELPGFPPDWFAKGSHARQGAQYP